MLRKGALAAGLALIALPAGAQESVEERAFWKAAFETARAYAADMSLVAYCVRADPELASFAPLGLIADLNIVAERARSGALDRRRMGELARDVLVRVRLPAPEDAADPALDKKCAEGHVAQEVLRLGPIALPLTLRPPFAKP